MVASYEEGQGRWFETGAGRTFFGHGSIIGKSGAEGKRRLAVTRAWQPSLAGD